MHIIMEKVYKLPIDIKTSVDVKINVPEKFAKIRNPVFWTFAAVEWHKLYKPWCPWNTGHLYQNVNISAQSGTGTIEHFMPYAGKVYDFNNNYRKDMAPNASAQWDKAAEPTQKPKLIKAMQAYVDNGRLNL